MMRRFALLICLTLCSLCPLWLASAFAQEQALWPGAKYDPAIPTIKSVLGHDHGEVITTPNGQIVQVTNLSRDWARAVIDVPVPATIDVSHVTEILRRVGEEAYSDDRLRKMLLDPPTVMGVEKIEVDTFSVRMVARTLPGIQFEVGRELRARVASAFRREGIIVAAELNNRPRKRLHWSTPAEALDALPSHPFNPPDVATTAW